MRTLEYLALTLLIGAAVCYGATKLGNVIGASLNNTAAQIERART